MKTLVRLSIGFLLATGTVALASTGCSSSSTTSPTTGSTSAKINAAQGGSITDVSGKATLAIPGGALAGDTEITLATSGAADGSQADVYNFGPDGTKFAKPATLAIKFAGAAPQGQVASLAIFEGGKWVAVKGSKLENGTVTGPVEHFTKFSVIFVNGDAVLVSSCGNTFQNFAACGGDVKGVWKMKDYCFDPKVLQSQSPFGAQCPTATAAMEFTSDQTWTIDATSITTSASTQTTKSIYNIPVSCLPAGANCAMYETSMKKNDPNAACPEVAGACNCTTSKTEQKPAPNPATQTYTISGNQIIVAPNTTGTDYCVKGSTLEVKAGKNGEGVIVFTKQ